VRPEAGYIARSLASSPDIKLDFVRIDERDRLHWPDRRLSDDLKPGKYNVYIIGDLDSSAFRKEDLQALHDSVAKNGAGLIMLGGFHSFWAGGYQKTPLADLLPLEVRPIDQLSKQDFDAKIREDLHLKPVPLADGPGPGKTGVKMLPDARFGYEPPMRLASRDQNRAAWEKLPPLDGANKFEALKVTARPLAECVPLLAARSAPTMPLKKTPTPGKSTCEDVAELLSVPLATTVKSLVLATDERTDDDSIKRTTIWLLLVRGDHALNEVKAGKVPGLDSGFRFASAAEIEDHFGCKPGYLGPIGTRKPVKLVADRTVARMSDFVCGANDEGFHYTGVNWGRDLPEPDVVADIRNAVAGDPSPDGKGILAIQRGIEVGHVFYLGTKYSEAMNASYLDESGKPQLMQMGCYGIGVTRILGAAIEQGHDERGIIWPDAMAPFRVVVCPIGWDRSDAVREAALRLHDELEALGVDTVLDDRGERPGAMFADWELIGVPHRVVLSDRGLKEGQLEIQGRREATASKAAISDAFRVLRERLHV
jgi:prolyl-tRNA editing enzyme YbaK/EbsC (Cys-tRNA(Pro) deacylase)